MPEHPYTDAGDIDFYRELRKLEAYLGKAHNFFRPGFDLKVEQHRRMKEEESSRYWAWRERKAAGFRKAISGRW